MKISYDIPFERLDKAIADLADREYSPSRQLLDSCPSVSALLEQRRISHSDKRIPVAMHELEEFFLSEIDLMTPEQKRNGTLTMGGVLRNLLHHGVAYQIDMIVAG
jgi:hypothetical protein